MKPQRMMGRPPKISRADIRAIRRAVAARKALTAEALSKRLGLSYGTVTKVASGWQPKRYGEAVET